MAVDKSIFPDLDDKTKKSKKERNRKKGQVKIASEATTENEVNTAGVEETPVEVEKEDATNAESTETTTESSESDLKEEAATLPDDASVEDEPAKEAANPTSSSNDTEKHQPDATEKRKNPKDKRKQIKLPPRLMGQIDAIKMMKKKTAYYEVLEEMIDFYVKQSFDDDERSKFNTIMSIFNDD